MLIKLLKYEFKFTGRSLLPIYAALLVLTVLMNLAMVCGLVLIMLECLKAFLRLC